MKLKVFLVNSKCIPADARETGKNMRFLRGKSGKEMRIWFSPKKGLFIENLDSSSTMRRLAGDAIIMNKRYGTNFKVVDDKGNEIIDSLLALKSWEVIQSDRPPQGIEFGLESEEKDIDPKNLKHIVRTRIFKVNGRRLEVRDVCNCEDDSCGYEHGPDVRDLGIEVMKL